MFNPTAERNLIIKYSLYILFRRGKIFIYCCTEIMSLNPVPWPKSWLHTCSCHAVWWHDTKCGTNSFVSFLLLLRMALHPGVGLGLRYNMPPGLSVPCSISPFVYTHLSQVHGHIIQPSHSWSSSSSCCIQLFVHHLFWDCCVLHSFYMTKPSYSLAFNKPDNVLSFDYGF